MNRKIAMSVFVYWGNAIVRPSGEIYEKAVEMRSAWAWAIDTGVYRKLPRDEIVADKIVLQKFRERRTP